MISMNQAIKELTFAGEYKPLPSQDVIILFLYFKN